LSVSSTASLSLPATLTVAYGQTFSLTVASDNSNFAALTPVLTGGVVAGAFSGSSYTSGPVTADATVYFPATTAGNVYVIGRHSIATFACTTDTIKTCPVLLDIYVFNNPTSTSNMHVGSMYAQGISPLEFDNSASTTNPNGHFKMIEIPNAPSAERHFTLSFPNGIGFSDNYPRFNNGTIDVLPIEFAAYTGVDDTTTQLSSGVSTENFGGLGFNPFTGLGVILPSMANATSTKIANNVYLSSTGDVVNVVLPCSDTKFWSDAMSLVNTNFVGPWDVEIVQSVGCTRGESNTPNGMPINNTVPGLGIPYVTTGSTSRAVHIPPSDLIGSSEIHEWRHGRGDHWTAMADSENHTSPSTELPGQLTAINGILTPVAGGGYTLKAPVDGKATNCRHFSTEDNLQEGLVNSMGSVGYLNPSYFSQEGVTIPVSQVVWPTMNWLQATYGTVPYVGHQTLKGIWVVVSDHQLVGAELGLAIANSEHFAGNTPDEASNTQGNLPVCSTPSLQVASNGLITISMVVIPITK